MPVWTLHVKENGFLWCECIFQGAVEVDQFQALALNLFLIHSLSKQNKKETAVGDEMSGLKWNLKYANNISVFFPDTDKYIATKL